jgi:hypothetical protein
MSSACPFKSHGDGRPSRKRPRDSLQATAYVEVDRPCIAELSIFQFQSRHMPSTVKGTSSSRHTHKCQLDSVTATGLEEAHGPVAKEVSKGRYIGKSSVVKKVGDLHICPFSIPIHCDSLVINRCC